MELMIIISSRVIVLGAALTCRRHNMAASAAAANQFANTHLELAIALHEAGMLAAKSLALVTGLTQTHI